MLMLLLSLLSAQAATVRASSTHKDADATYTATRAVDGSFRTSWAEATPGTAEGEPVDATGKAAAATGKSDDAKGKSLDAKGKFAGTAGVLDAVFDHQTYGLALPSGSIYRKRINERLLVRQSNESYWRELQARFLGEQ